MMCEEFRPRLDDLALLTLSADEAERVEGHAAACADCRRILEDARALVMALGRLGRIDPAPRPSVKTPRFRPVFYYLAVAAEVLFLATALVLLSEPKPLPAEGEICVLRGAEWQPVREAPIGRRLQARGSGAALPLPAGDRIRMAPRAEVTVLGERSAQVHSGEAEFEVVRRPESFEVRVPFGRIVVRGTRFRVEVSERRDPMKTAGAGALALMISLTSGAVDFHADSGSVTSISAGMKLSVTADGSSLSWLQDGGKCCESLEKAWYCRGCEGLLGDSDVEEHAFAAGNARAAKVCKACKGDAENDPKKVYAAIVRQVDACVRTYFECKECKKTSRAADRCHDEDMAKKTSRARVQYACEGCGFKMDQPGVCRGWSSGGAGCQKKGDALKATCTGAGKFPHTD